jgi:branched-chain amino acid transport system ATP-binding protein
VSDTPLLAVRGLSTYYGHSQALFDVDMVAGPRGAVAVLGRNGAGKTTLLRTIVGELRPREGQIAFEGRDDTRTPTEQRVRRGPWLCAAGARGLRPVVGAGKPCRRRGDAARSRRRRRGPHPVPKLGQRLNQRAGTLSGGERKMLAVGRALLTRPKLLLLDEPTEGVWIGVIEEIAGRLNELASRIGLILVEQHLELALAVAQYAYVLDRGRVALEGPSATIKNDPRLLRYLAP